MSEDFPRLRPALVLVLIACADGAGGPVVPPPPPPPGPPTLAVRTSSSSVDPDGDGYAIRVNGGAPFQLGPNDVEDLGVVAAGIHTAILEDLAPRCTVANGPERSLNVGSTGAHSIWFAVSCETLFHDVMVFSKSGQLIFIDLAGDVPDSPRMQRYEGICALEECKDPVISPDGRLIAFTDRVHTYIARVATGNVTATFRNDSESYLEPLTWAPDGSAVAFIARVPGNSGRDLYVRSVSIGGLGPAVRLRHDNIDISEPAWSPDGQWIAYSRHPWGDAKYEVWMIRPDGTGARPLAPSASSQRWPTWSPDGASIAYLSDGAIRLHTLATGVESTLQLSVVSPEALRFTPDGNALVFAHYLGECLHALSQIDRQSGVVTRLHTSAPDCDSERLPLGAVSWGTQ